MTPVVPAADPPEPIPGRRDVGPIPPPGDTELARTQGAGPAPAAEKKDAAPAAGTVPPLDGSPPTTTPAAAAADSTGAAPGPGPVPGGPGAGRRPADPPPPNAGVPDDSAISELATDRLPLGKQSIAVTVDVQTPPSMNLNQPATLRLVVKNSGTSEAMNVRILDDLPDGLQYVSSQPEAFHREGDSLLSWRMNTLPAGSERIITVKVVPKKPGAFEHGATVWFQTGSKSRSRVLKPRLKVDQAASASKVLKGQAVEFKVGVTNIGDGPARNVTIQARLTGGLRHGSAEPSEDQMLYELTLPDLAPGQHTELDPLVADAIQGGDQSCTVTATSPDVIPFVPPEAESTRTITVVEPRLKLTLAGPDRRYSDTVAPYEITVENPGTAPARRVRVQATLPVSGRLIAVPKGAEYDTTTRRLQWALDAIEPGGKFQLGFEVRVVSIGFYEVTTEARGEGGLQTRDRHSTEVIGMPDVDLVVSERQRVVDVGGRTTFQIRLRNYGTKEATNLLMTATLSKNLKVKGAPGVPEGVQAWENGGVVKFVDAEGRGISKLGPGKELIMGLEVEVTDPEPRMATCRVSVTHDDLGEAFDDMAGVKIMTSRRPATVRP